MSTAIHRRVAALQAGRDPTLIARLASGWAVFGERQVLRGYALLLPDPVVPHLNALAGPARYLKAALTGCPSIASDRRAERRQPTRGT